MVCQDCGYVLAPFETACPRCARLKALKKTRRLPDIRSMVTQHLVQLGQCPHCKFMVFPGETHCSSCGASVRSAMKQTKKDRAAVPPSRRDRRQWLVGLVVSAVTLGVVVYLFRSFYPR